MLNQRGFATITVILALLAVAVLGGMSYVAVNPQVMTQLNASTAITDDGVQTEPGDHREVDHGALDGLSEAEIKAAISWKFETLAEKDGTPQTKVSVSVNGTVHETGTFAGSCSEVGATGGIDGKGLLAGELSAAQCWFAGGGDEIGVFAHEDGGYEVMVGELGEPSPESPGFRGNFKIKASVSL